MSNISEQKQSELSHERLLSILFYNPETGLFTWRIEPRQNVASGSSAGSLQNGYIHIMYNRLVYKAHRLAWFYVYGSWPRNVIDHIDRDKLNNRISNLRCVTPSENRHNSKKAVNNTSGYVGVHYHKGNCRWNAKIMVNNKAIHLGSFWTKEEAVRTRKVAELKYLNPVLNETQVSKEFS